MSEGTADKSIREARDIARLARDAVKQELIEGMTPGIQRMVDRVLRERAGLLNEGDSGMKDDDKDLGLESISGMFAGLQEMEGPEDEDGVHVDIGSHLGEAEDPFVDEAAEGGLDEEIEISEAELTRHVEAALRTEGRMDEVQSSKGFKDLDLSGKEEVDQGNAVHDVKSGEHYFETQEPPAKKDWTVKEIKALVKKGIAENEQLRAQVAELKASRAKLAEDLRKTNLFNAKMLYAHKIFTENVSLDSKTRRTVVESLDSAETVREVKRTAENLQKVLGKNVSESKKNRAAKGNSARVRTRGGADQRVVRESLERAPAESNGSGQYNRWSELAGLVK